MADCSWDFEYRAFYDSNQDGIWDDGEAPLSGVEIALEHAWYGDITRSTTNSTGEASASKFGSCQFEWIIRAQVPDNMIATTEIEIEAFSPGEYSFGFID